MTKRRTPDLQDAAEVKFSELQEDFVNYRKEYSGTMTTLTARLSKAKTEYTSNKRRVNDVR
jgi:hypothetical protein